MLYSRSRYASAAITLILFIEEQVRTAENSRLTFAFYCYVLVFFYSCSTSTCVSTRSRSRYRIFFYFPRDKSQVSTSEEEEGAEPVCVTQFVGGRTVHDDGSGDHTNGGL